VRLRWRGDRGSLARRRNRPSLLVTFSRSAPRFTLKQAAALLRKREPVRLETPRKRAPRAAPSEGSAPEQLMAATLKIAGVQGWEREFAFHPKRGWRFDFAWPNERVALEIEGGVFSRGAHARPKGIVRDIRKSTEAQLLGWIVLRVLPRDVRRGLALQLVERALEIRRGSDAPSDTHSDGSTLVQTCRSTSATAPSAIAESTKASRLSGQTCSDSPGKPHPKTKSSASGSKSRRRSTST